MRKELKMEGGLLVFVVGIIIVIMVILFVLLAVIASRLYKKAQPDMAFVRTGQGGAKVVMNGGSLVIPVLHNMTYVNLQTMRLPVIRKGKEALITADKLRADVEAEFFIRVEPNKDKILTASRSLGSTGEVSQDTVLELVGPKLVSALRSVSATKALIEIHQNRIEFANAVHSTLQQDLSENGLTLESVAISQLDASDFRSEANYFDAQGLRHITDTLQSALKAKNDIERDTEIAIKDKNVSSRMTILELEKKEEQAKLKQQQEIEYTRASQKKSIEVANKEQWSETNKKNIEFEQVVVAEQALREAEAQKISIDNKRNVEEAEINKKLFIDKTRIDSEIKILAADEEKRIKQQQVEINVVTKESERLKSEALKEQAKQDIITVEEKAKAERNKIVEIVTAEAEAKQKEINQKIQVDVDAYKVLQVAKAEFESSDLKAKAIERLAKAELEQALAEARGQEALIEANNKANVNNILMELVAVLPEVTKELMAPAGKISDVKIFSMNGVDASGSNGLGRTLLNSGMLLPLLEEIASGKNIKELLGTLGSVMPKGHSGEKTELEPVHSAGSKPESHMVVRNTESTPET